jgi:hypothetical protein
MDAKALLISKCVECPFVGTPGPEQPLARCTHPDREVYEAMVVLERKPPVTCPLRELPMVLHVAGLH